MTTEIKNCKIARTSLGFEDHGILTFTLHLEYDVGGVGFGGYVLVGNFTGEAIACVLKTVGVTNWEQLPGRHVRAEVEYGSWEGCKQIGHIIEDKWCNLKVLSEATFDSKDTLVVI